MSNRLPFSLGPNGAPTPSAGGLVSALEGVRERVELSWIGWSGAAPARRTPEVDEAERRAVRDAAEAGGCDCRPVLLDAAAVEGSYRGFSNTSLWPLLHDDAARFRHRRAWWDAYAAANGRFADAVAEAAAPGDRVWVHDYHLMLLPGLLRRRRPDLSIGFFLHTPFPPAELFRRHPRRVALLAGVLGADLVGFQTPGHRRNFEEAAQRFAGARSDGVGIRHGDATTAAGVFPVGIHAAAFERGLADPATAAEVDRLAAAHAGRKLVLSVERLDPTKGIPQKLDAIERFLGDHPERREAVLFLLIAVPSREDAEDSRRLRGAVDAAVGRINAEHGTASHAPVRVLHRGVEPHELCALYRSADVCLVTPLADGMNLVAKEYAACQPEGGAGVLVLSEFAGAAEELTGASLVNPHDTDALADEIAAALDRPEAGRREAMAPMREHARTRHAGPWAESFLAALRDAAGRRRPERAATRPVPPRPLGEADLAPFAAGAPGRKALFLDYDGTLRGFVDDPEAATPGPRLRSLLDRLGGREDLDVFVVSGRGMGFLRQHLGRHGATLVAEHGHAVCAPDETPRRLGAEAGAGGGGGDWMPGVEAAMREAAARCPGARVERKSAGLVWHHRCADPEPGLREAAALARRLEALAAGGSPVVTRGHGIVEATRRGVDKGAAVSHFLGSAEAAGAAYAAVLCIGDDRTDEAMFRACRGRAEAVTVKVGAGPTAAGFRLAGVDGVLRSLERIAGPVRARAARPLAAV